MLQRYKRIQCQGNMQLRNVRFIVRKSPVIQIVSISKVSKSVVAGHPVIHPKKGNASSCHCVRLYFCKPILQICYKDTSASIRKRATHRRVQSTESPIYFVYAGTKPRFLTKKGHQKSGIPCSGRVIACVCIFVNPSCKCFTKIRRVVFRGCSYLL